MLFNLFTLAQKKYSELYILMCIH